MLYSDIVSASAFFNCLWLCHTGSKKADIFPPSPDLPHVQYLTSISSQADIKKPSLFDPDDPTESLKKPYGIAVKGSKIYVSDTPFAAIHIIDLDKKTFSQLKQTVLQSPINVTFDADGNLYVADSVAKSVFQFRADESIDSYTEADTKPTDMAIRGNDLFMLDYSKSEIKIFDKNTKNIIGTIGREGKEEDTLSLPTNMALDKEGNIYVTNLGTCRVIKMDRSGKVLKAFGEVGDRPGQFSRPKGIAVDEGGLIYVVDAGNQVVQIFNQETQLLMFFGERGSKQGTLNLPADIAVSRENLDYFKTFADPSFEVEQLIYVTNQAGPRKISVYGFGHSKDPGKFMKHKK